MRTKRQRLDRIALKPLLATATEIERDLQLAGYRGHSVSLVLNQDTVSPTE